MATVTSGNWQKALWPGIEAWINDSYDAHETEFTQLFTSKTSSKAFEQMVGQSLLGLASVKDEGNPIQYDDTQQTYVNQFNQVVYALGTVITKEAFTDNQYNLDALSRRPKALAKSMQETKEVDHANVLNRGFNTAYTMGATSDALPLFSAAHLNGPYGATSSNLDTAADLSETTLEDSMVAINTMTDPRGLKIRVTADTLWIPPALLFIASRILDSALQNDTAHNAVNALRTQNSLPGGYKVNHYFTDSDAWYVTTSINRSGEGLVTYQGWEREQGVDGDFNTFDMKVKISERWARGWGEWRAIRGNAGA